MSILKTIVEQKQIEVKLLKQKNSINKFKDMPFYKAEQLSFYNALNKNNKISLIAEIKKASPSKGIIKPNFNHLEIADIYMQNNVNAISVLTDEMFFMGNITYLNDIAAVKSVPLLRKDFIIDEIQIHQAKANGADAVLLITEILYKNQIIEYTELAKELKMDVLLELHSEKQLDKIDFDINKIIGVNNRNLETFVVDINTTVKIAKYLPKETIIVSESGIKTKQDLDYLKNGGINAILVGEQLMSSNNIQKAIEELQNGCTYES